MTFSYSSAICLTGFYCIGKSFLLFIRFAVELLTIDQWITLSIIFQSKVLAADVVEKTENFYSWS